MNKDSWKNLIKNKAQINEVEINEMQERYFLEEFAEKLVILSGKVNWF